jgi:hypothetical protein
MFPEKCKAVIRSDNLLEYGFISFKPEIMTVDFTGSFVPLLKVGTRVEIICGEGGRQTHVLLGDVFYSTGNVMRLVNITGRLLEKAERVLTVTKHIEGRLNMKTAKKGTVLACIITELTAKGIGFRCPKTEEMVWEGLTVTVGAPIFREPVKLCLQPSKQSLLFGKSAKYVCDFGKLPPEIRKDILHFIRNEHLLLING